MEKAQLELENQLGSDRRESIRPKSANVQNASHTMPTQIEPKKPERNNALRRAKSTNDTGTQDLIQKHKMLVTLSHQKLSAALFVVMYCIK